MKSVKDYIAQDMPGHIMMSGDAILGCVTGETCPTLQEKHEYCKGIMTMFPHMLLANFSRWFWEAEAPRDYSAFMDASAPQLQAQVFPVLERVFDEAEPLPESQRGALLIPLLTDVIPKHVLGGFYQYMFAGTEDYKDIAAFWPTVEPLLQLTARSLALAYDDDAPLPLEEKAELYLFIGTRLPFLLIKRWYDWQFGKEKMEMPPPPPQD
jgi:hypothetical protein